MTIFPCNFSNIFALTHKWRHSIKVLKYPELTDMKISQFTEITQLEWHYRSRMIYIYIVIHVVLTSVWNIHDILIAHRNPSRHNEAIDESSQSCKPTLNAAKNGVQAIYKLTFKYNNLYSKTLIYDHHCSVRETYNELQNKVVVSVAAK